MHRSTEKLGQKARMPTVALHRFQLRQRGWCKTMLAAVYIPACCGGFFFSQGKERKHPGESKSISPASAFSPFPSLPRQRIAFPCGRGLLASSPPPSFTSLVPPSSLCPRSSLRLPLRSALHSGDGSSPQNPGIVLTLHNADARNSHSKQLSQKKRNSTRLRRSKTTTKTREQEQEQEGSLFPQ